MSNDTISRQKVFDLFDAWEAAELDHHIPKILRDRLKIMPSAEPEPCEDVVSRRRLLSDLKELIAAWEKYPVMAEQIKGVEVAIGYVETIPSVKPNSKELSSTQKPLDTISRTAAIDAIKKESQVDGAYGYMDTKSIIDCLNELPSAQPEIIQCKDCKYHHRDNSGAYYCERKEYGYGWGLNDFCSDAERKEN